MYVLISISGDDFRYNELISSTKKKIEDYLKGKGYYFSKINNRYVDDKNVKIKGGSGTDYIINKVRVI